MEMGRTTVPGAGRVAMRGRETGVVLSRGAGVSASSGRKGWRSCAAGRVR